MITFLWGDSIPQFSKMREYKGKGGSGGDKGAVQADRLSFQECVWRRLRTSQHSVVTGAPALLQGARGKKEAV